MVSVGEIKEKLHTKAWGERSLTLGELAGFIVAGILLFVGKRWLGKWTMLVAFAVIFICCALF